jgi:hypothetical protein
MSLIHPPEMQTSYWETLLRNLFAFHSNYSIPNYKYMIDFFLEKQIQVNKIFYYYYYRMKNSYFFLENNIKIILKYHLIA